MQRYIQYNVSDILSYLFTIMLNITYLLVKFTVESFIKGYEKSKSFVTTKFIEIIEKLEKKRQQKEMQKIRQQKIKARNEQKKARRKRAEKRVQIIANRRVSHIEKIKNKTQIITQDNHKRTKCEEFVPISEMKAKAFVKDRNYYENYYKNQEENIHNNDNINYCENTYIKHINIFEENLQILENKIALTFNVEEKQKLQNQVTVYQFAIQDTIMDYQKTLTKSRNSQTRRRR